MHEHQQPVNGLLARPTLPSHDPIMRSPEHAFRVLVELTRALTERVLELNEALQIVTDAARELFAGQHASVRIIDDSGKLLVSLARSGRGSHRSPVSFRRGEGVIGWVIDHGRVARVNDTDADPRFKRIDAQGYPIRSLLAIPLWSAGRVIGCLSVTSDQKDHFGEEDETIGRLLANCAVPPLERARLQHLAATDELTGALRQTQLVPTLERAMQNCADTDVPLAILSMDLDHFKHVNDTHGHAAGDEVLRIFAQRVRGAIRGEDIFVRRGGEEFVVILPNCDLTSAKCAAERIRDEMAYKPVVIGDLRVVQRVSVGVALWDRLESAQALDDRADQALYAAKRTGRNRVSVAP